MPVRHSIALADAHAHLVTVRSTFVSEGGALPDPLVVATRELKVGEEIGLGDLRPVETIARGHKMATKPIGDGEPVRKLGQVIGIATKPIQPMTARTIMATA